MEIELDVIYHDDVMKRLRKLPSESVKCVVTSVPYWGLRDYGVRGQLGLEKTPELYIRRMVKIFREIRRVLVKDGILWLNVGDTWWGGKGQSGSENWESRQERYESGRAITKPEYAVAGFRGGMRPQDGKHKIIKTKDMVGIPWMLALALRNDGWSLRQDIIWHKKNPMPESAKDRCTKAHEYVFLLAKSTETIYWVHRDRAYADGVYIKPEAEWRWINKDTKEELTAPPAGWQEVKAVKKLWKKVNLWRGCDYYFDHAAIQEEASYNTHPKVSMKKVPRGWDTGDVRGNGLRGRYSPSKKTAENMDLFGVKNNSSFTESTLEDPDIRNKRDVWTVDDGSGVWEWLYQNAPDALLVSELYERYTAALLERGSVWSMVPDSSKNEHTATFPLELPKLCILAGTRTGETVLDPFIGTGTTAEAAKRLERHFIGIELNKRDVEVSRDRVRKAMGLFYQEIRRQPVSNEVYEGVEFPTNFMDDDPLKYLDGLPNT